MRCSGERKKRLQRGEKGLNRGVGLFQDKEKNERGGTIGDKGNRKKGTVKSKRNKKVQEALGSGVSS